MTDKPHSRGVAAFARRFAEGCGLDPGLYEQAGLWHDLGKLDPRFQAMLRMGSPRTAVGKPLAKSAKWLRTPREREEAREVHRYPAGARHELLSAALVGEKTADDLLLRLVPDHRVPVDDVLVGEKTADDLLLHLIATHHGSARPFAGPVEENDSALEPFAAELFDTRFEAATSAQRVADWNAELPERFWRVVRKYGWWGSAYREAVFRLADHAQSRAEQEDAWKPVPSTPAACSLPARVGRPAPHALPLPGLDGSNPLAFLAAVGTLRCLTAFARQPYRPSWLDGWVSLSWGRPGAPFGATLHLPGEPSAGEVTDYLARQLAVAVPDGERRRVMAKDVIESIPEQLQDHLSPLESDRRNAVLNVISAVVTEQLTSDDRDLASLRKRPEEVKKHLVRRLDGICPKSALAKKGPGKVKEMVDERLDRELYDHPAALAVALVEGKDVNARDRFIRLGRTTTPGTRDVADWAAAHHSELVPDEGSQLLIVRSDYLRGNLLGVFQGTSADHIRRAIFAPWDYADGLDNQSLHWEPSEDRRHAYQWHQPNGDPTKADRGGMLGANRLALEAWPLFVSIPRAGKLRTRGFRGKDIRDTYWTWPLWASRLTADAVGSILSIPGLQADRPSAADLRGFGITAVFRTRRILVGKTPNLTPAVAAD